MAAYVIADVDVFDAETYADYRRQVPASLEPFGGRFIVRGGATTVLEGDWEPRRIVVLEFPDMASLNAWYASPAYQPLVALRQSCARGNLIAVEGAA